jgi:hypothetical protein
MDTLVARLKERIEACNTNISRASLEMGFGRQILRDIINGRSKSPSIAVVEAAARVLDCSVSYLVGETDEPNTPQSSQTGRGKMVEIRTKSDGFMLRLPDGLRDRVKSRADTNGRSMNSEIVHCIEASFEPSRVLAPIITDALHQYVEAEVSKRLKAIADELTK